MLQSHARRHQQWLLQAPRLVESMCCKSQHVVNRWRLLSQPERAPIHYVTYLLCKIGTSPWKQLTRTYLAPLLPATFRHVWVVLTSEHSDLRLSINSELWHPTSHPSSHFSLLLLPDFIPLSCTLGSPGQSTLFFPHSLPHGTVVLP